MSSDAPLLRRAAVVVNPTKVDDVRGVRDAVTTRMREAGWDTPLWMETTPSTTWAKALRVAHSEVRTDGRGRQA